jgi:hypothetical protein
MPNAVSNSIRTDHPIAGDHSGIPDFAAGIGTLEDHGCNRPMADTRPEVANRPPSRRDLSTNTTPLSELINLGFLYAL